MNPVNNRHDPGQSGYSAALVEHLLQTYMIEGMALLGDGVPAEEIEASACANGFEHGPLWWIDHVGLAPLDELLHRELHAIANRQHGTHKPAGGEAGHGNHDHGDAHGADHHHHHDVKSERMPESAVYVLEKMAHGYGRKGRDGGAGFYDYEPGFDDELWDGLSAFSRGKRKVDKAHVAERLLIAVAREAVQTGKTGKADVPEGAPSTRLPAKLDFPADGDPWRWIEQIGQAALHERAMALVAHYGERFQINHSLPNNA